MRASLATTDQLYRYQGFELLTPRGWSDESKKLQDAAVVSLSDFLILPASRLHLHESDDRRPALRVAVQDLNDILVVFRNRLPENMCDQIRKRTSVLIDPAEWDFEDELPSPESFRRLLSFLEANSVLRYPSIFLNRYGLFTASWRPEKRKLASLVFHADNSVNWLVFSPREDDETDMIETAGRTSLNTVLKEVGKHGALSWMQRPTLLARLLARLLGNA